MGTIFPHKFQHHYRPIGKNCKVVDHAFGDFRCYPLIMIQRKVDLGDFRCYPLIMIQRKVAAELNFEFVCPVFCSERINTVFSSQ